MMSRGFLAYFRLCAKGLLDEQGDYDADEPTMPGSDDELSDLEEDVYLDDVKDDDDDN